MHRTCRASEEGRDREIGDGVKRLRTPRRENRNLAGGLRRGSWPPGVDLQSGECQHCLCCCKMEEWIGAGVVVDGADSRGVVFDSFGLFCPEVAQDHQRVSPHLRCLREKEKGREERKRESAIGLLDVLGSIGQNKCLG